MNIFFTRLFGSGSIVIFIIFGIVIFFVSREILTWYWKTNKIVRILERIERSLRKDGIKYPDEEYDEEYFKNNKIKIPGENPPENK